MLYVDNSCCIDCFACIPACPVQAIYSETDLPEDKLVWMAINDERAATLPVVKKASDPLPTAAAKRAALGF
jgi:Fe-S-cluster-containing hydrogenase component 2